MFPWVRRGAVRAAFAAGLAPAAAALALAATASAAHAEAAFSLTIVDSGNGTTQEGGRYDDVYDNSSIALGAASASGIADLSSGLLRASATAPAMGTSVASGDIRDNVTFTGTAGGTAYLDYHWDGRFSALASDANGGQGLSSALLLVSMEGTAGLQTYEYTLFNSNSPKACDPHGVGPCGFGLAIDQTASLPFTFQPGVNAIQVDLAVTTRNGVTADFSHTANIALRLPTGDGFTSDTGVFLNTAAPISPVPEPGAAALLLAGLGALALRARRRGVA